MRCSTQEIFFTPTLLVTKRVKDGPNFKGGVTNYPKFKNDVHRLLHSSGGALVVNALPWCCFRSGGHPGEIRRQSVVIEHGGDE